MRLIAAILFPLLVGWWSSPIVGLDFFPGPSCNQTALDATKVYYYANISSPGVSLDEISLSDINADREIKVLIHGWIGNRNHISIAPVRNAYLLRGDVNFMIADWRMCAGMSYDISRRSVQPVGFKVGEILEKFIQGTFPMEKIHVLGHSLGSHVAGGVGRYFKGKLGRITGLDPAGPFFFESNNDLLSPGDAMFVDVIHTAAKTLGFYGPLGHIDFYPNNGLPLQPGCATLDIVTAFSCSHYKAPLNYAESILLPNDFPSVECNMKDIGDAMGSKCSKTYNKTSMMGENVDQSLRGVFYLETNNVFPFGKGTVEMTPPQEG